MMSPAFGYQATRISLLGVTFIAAAALSNCVSASAQSTTRISEQRSAATAWHGVRLPAGLGNPHRPIIDLSAAKLSPPIVPAGEQRFRALEGAAIRRDLEAIVNIARADRARGAKAWGRITGLPAADETHAWVLQQFKAAGLKNAETQTYPATQPVWVSTTWEVKLLATSAAGAGSRDVVLESAFPTTGSQMSAPLTAPLVLVGATSDPALPDVDVKGKIAVQKVHPQAGAYSERTATTNRARELVRRGAVAIVNVIEQAGNMHVRDFGSIGVPCFNLGTDDGRFLREVAAKAGMAADLRMSLTLTSEMRSGLKGHNTLGIVAGRRADEIVIVNAHADGWFDAAGDNGDGLAVLVALARHFAAPENQPERTLLFVASGGHHTGGMNGPANFVTMNPQLVGKAVLVVNLEHIAQLYFKNDPFRLESGEQPMRFDISNQAPGIAEIARRGVQRYGFVLLPEFSGNTPGDLGGYTPLGIPRVQAIHAGPMYHTSGDTLESISTPGLERAARFYAFFVSEVTKAERSVLQP